MEGSKSQRDIQTLQNKTKELEERINSLSDVAQQSDEALIVILDKQALHIQALTTLVLQLHN